MNLQFYLERLHEAGVFKEFFKGNKDAYMCSAFFIIDKEGNENKTHFDFFIPKEKKASSFQSSKDGDFKLVPLESFNDKVPEEIKKADIDFEKVEKLILNEMEKNKIKDKIQKIIISLQKIDGKDTLLCTIFISMMGIINLKIDLETRKIDGFEKRSIFDMIRIVKK